MPGPKSADENDPEIEREAEDIVETITKLAEKRISIGAAGIKSLSARLDALTTNDPVNQYELTSIKALIAYLAHTQKLPPESLHSLLGMKFEVDTIEEIKRGDYQHAIKFLVDLQGYGSLN